MKLPTVEIVRLEDPLKGAVNVSGFNGDGLVYKPVPARNFALTAQAWPWKPDSKSIKDEQVTAVLAILQHSLLPPSSQDSGWVVGPALRYSQAKAELDPRGVLIWQRGDRIAEK